MTRRNLIERRFVATGAAQIEVRAEGDATELHGYGIVFNQWAEIRDGWGTAFMELWAPGSTAKTIAEADIRSLFNHDPNIVLGRNRANTLTLQEDATGLRTLIRPPASAWGASVTEAIRRGDVSGMSAGFTVMRDEWERPEKRGDLYKRTIREAKLLDVGPVTFPAFPTTSIQARADGVDGVGPDDTCATAVRLALLAQAGLALDDEERRQIEAAVRFLQRWTGRRDAPGESAHPSPAVTPGEIAHLAEARARVLALLKQTL